MGLIERFWIEKVFKRVTKPTSGVHTQCYEEFSSLLQTPTLLKGNSSSGPPSPQLGRRKILGRWGWSPSEEDCFSFCTNGKNGSFISAVILSRSFWLLGKAQFLRQMSLISLYATCKSSEVLTGARLCLCLSCS